MILTAIRSHSLRRLAIDWVCESHNHQRTMSGPAGAQGVQTLAGRTGQVLTNAPLAKALSLGRPDGVVPANIVNIPGWTKTEYDDLTIKSPTGSTPGVLDAFVDVRLPRGTAP